MAVTNRSSQQEILKALNLFVHVFDGDKLHYDFDDFHIDLLSRYARCFSGERVFVSYEKIKETGFTTLTLSAVKFACALSLKKHIRFVHSDVHIVSEFMNAMYNFLIDPLTIHWFSQQVAGAEKREKKRYTQSIIQTMQGVTIRGATSMVPATGSVSLEKGARPDLIIVDDVANLHTLDSEVRSGRQKRLIDETILSGDQLESSVFFFRNPNAGIDMFAEQVDKDERFEHIKIFLYRPDGSLRWKADDETAGKYTETAEEADALAKKFPDRRKPVAVEELRKAPNYRSSFLGEKVDYESLYIKTRQVPSKPVIEQIMGVETHLFGTFKGNELVVIGTDHSVGQGGHNQALVVLGSKNLEVLATIESNRIETDVFAEAAAHLYRRITEAEVERVLFAPENDGAEGAAYIRLLIREHDMERKIWRAKDDMKQDSGLKKDFGYKPTFTGNKRITRELKDIIEKGDCILNCERLLRDLSMYTYTDYMSPKAGPFGHFDLLRAAAIAYEAITNPTDTYSSFHIFR